MFFVGVPLSTPSVGETRLWQRRSRSNRGRLSCGWPPGACAWLGRRQVPCCLHSKVFVCLSLFCFQQMPSPCRTLDKCVHPKGFRFPAVQWCSRQSPPCDERGAHAPRTLYRCCTLMLASETTTRTMYRSRRSCSAENRTSHTVSGHLFPFPSRPTHADTCFFPYCCVVRSPLPCVRGGADLPLPPCYDLQFPRHPQPITV